MGVGLRLGLGLAAAGVHVFCDTSPRGASSGSGAGSVSGCAETAATAVAAVIAASLAAPGASSSGAGPAAATAAAAVWLLEDKLTGTADAAFSYSECGLDMRQTLGVQRRDTERERCGRRVASVRAASVGRVREVARGLWAWEE